MESVSIILILVGLGCITMGIILLTQDTESVNVLCKDYVRAQRKDVEDTIKSREEYHPIEEPKDRIWMQETREQSHQLRPYPAYV